MDKATEKALERVRRADDGWPDGGAVNVCARDLRPILAAAEESEKLRAALNWYADEARAIARHMATKSPNAEACMASLTVLSLDGGKRAARALTGTGEKS